LKTLPLHVGDAVEGIILERSPSVFEGESPSQAEAKKAKDRPEPNLYSLRGTILFYEDPFELAVSVEHWKAL
jgi:hypothetical protein